VNFIASGKSCRKPYISTADLETLMGNFKSMCQLLKALFLDAILEVVGNCTKN